jgi:hypothetical protein
MVQSQGMDELRFSPGYIQLVLRKCHPKLFWISSNKANVDRKIAEQLSKNV